jgi:hypothetical protein
LAGLVVAIPVLLIGLKLSRVEPLPVGGPYSMEGNSLLYAGLKYIVFGQLLPAPDSYGGLWNPDFVPTPALAPHEGYYTAAMKQAGYCCSLIGGWNSSLTHQPGDFGFENRILRCG